MDSWAELLQTYKQSSAGLRYAFLWTRGQSYFGLMGGASSEAWMDFNFTDVFLFFPSSLQRSSSSSSSSFLLFWLEQQRRAFAIQEAGVIRGGRVPPTSCFLARPRRWDEASCSGLISSAGPTVLMLMKEFGSPLGTMRVTAGWHRKDSPLPSEKPTQPGILPEILHPS